MFILAIYTQYYTILFYFLITFADIMRKAIALLMLLTFTVSFTVFCRCTAKAAMPHCCCCEKKQSPPTHKDCQGMHAVQFNLIEKQVTPHVELPPLMAMTMVTAYLQGVTPAASEPLVTSIPDYSPPDRLALFQLYRI